MPSRKDGMDALYYVDNIHWENIRSPIGKLGAINLLPDGLYAEISLVDELAFTPHITNVIFNKPATIVIWSDGTKTVVKAGKKEKYDREKGLAMCIAKKFLGNKGSYYNTFKEWLDK